MIPYRIKWEIQRRIKNIPLYTGIYVERIHRRINKFLVNLLIKDKQTKSNLHEVGFHEYYVPCTKKPRCCKGFSSFWKTIIESPQWEAWKKEQHKRFSTCCNLSNEEQKKTTPKIYDVDECTECGWISQEHLQEFLLFVYLETENQEIK